MAYHQTRSRQKFERLPQQGIETDPGPFQSQAQPATATTGTQHNGQRNSSSSNEQEESNEDDDDDPAHIQHKDQCSVLSVNTGGAPGIWKLIKQVIPSSYPEIICIQEAALSTNEYKAIHKQLHSLGYSTYYSKGQHLRKVTGGVLTAIRREIPHSLQYKHEEDAFQHTLIQVGEWMLLNTYIPPRPALLGQALATTTAIFEACVINSGDRPWLWLGDFNSDVNQLNSAAETQGGKLLYSQSTYKHHRKIDHIWTNSPAHCSKGSIITTRISDHKILKTKINLQWKKTVRRGTLHKPHVWTTPPVTVKKIGGTKWKKAGARSIKAISWQSTTIRPNYHHNSTSTPLGRLLSTFFRKYYKKQQVIWTIQTTQKNTISSRNGKNR